MAIFDKTDSLLSIMCIQTYRIGFLLYKYGKEWSHTLPIKQFKKQFLSVHDFDLTVLEINKNFSQYRNRFLNLIESNQMQIVITPFRLI